MGRKMIGLIIGMLVVTLLLPSITATSTGSTKKEIFTNCYIEASGEIDFTWKLNDIPIGLRYRFISAWPIVFNEPNVDVTIYSKKNGEVIWQDNFESGQWGLYLVGFIGKYNNDGSTADTLIANLDGRACFVMISTSQNSNDYPMKDNEIIATQNVDHYSNCYVEIDGLLSDEDYSKIFDMGPFWKIYFLRLAGNGNPPSSVLYWYIRLDETAQITIKSEENGDILWSNDNLYEQEIRILRFNGEYISSFNEEGRIKKDIQGNVQTIWIKDLVH